MPVALGDSTTTGLDGHDRRDESGWINALEIKRLYPRRGGWLRLPWACLMSTAPEAMLEPMAEDEMPRLVEQLLEEQQSLSAVERFSQKHDDADRPTQERYYRDLIPIAPPGKGQQYAFRVDLDACTGCKACVTACHSMNGLDADETWREVGVLLDAQAEQPFVQTVTTACHHCEEPACAAGCPTQAYQKDPATGIVRHLDDQCIGCQYCILKCPYDVPKYSPSRGIVRKCDMCHGRLAAGEAPACVQACPSGAISIRIVDPADRPEMLLPLEADGMPSSSITRPTTRYVSRRQRPETLRAADHESLRPADAHTPLAVMLVAVQLSFGVLLIDRIAYGLGADAPGSAAHALAVLLAAGVALAGQAAATLHLGRPQFAFRAFLGWRTSWMSREILTFGAYLGAIVAYAAAHWVSPIIPQLGLLPVPAELVLSTLGVAALVTGLAGTICSVMIYVDTQREFWSLRRTASRFFGTATLLGLAALWLCIAVSAVYGGAASDANALSSGTTLPFILGLAIATALKLAGETYALRHLRDSRLTTLRRSAALIVGPLRSVFAARLALGALGGIVVPLSAIALAGAGTSGAILLAFIALACLTAGEFLERHLFFRAVASRGMPGQI